MLMDTTSKTKMDRGRLLRILEEIYRAVPEILPVIAPHGWKKTVYFRNMMQERRQEHQEFLDTLPQSLSERDPANDCCPRWQEPETDESHNDEYYPNFEEYFDISYPPLYDDFLEIYYILTYVLTDITYSSLLIEEGSSRCYYIDVDEALYLSLSVAYRAGRINKTVHDLRAFVCPAPILDDMDSIYCLELIFRILRQQGYSLVYWDQELLYIRELQQSREELLYAPISPEQREESDLDILSRLRDCLWQYDRNWTVDVMDLREIVELFNRKKTCPIVLSYLHAYGEFPEGYPYTFMRYNDEADWD